MRSHPSAADDAAVIDAALAPKGAFYSHRSPPRLRISAGSLPLPGVETVPAASPSHAAGTPYSVR